MSTKTINTRIGLKYDLYTNWVAVEESFKPYKGEVIFFEIPSEPNPNVMQTTPPAILFKVGDGENYLKDLPWGSAIAADVYAWAKQQSLLGGTYNEGTWTFGETNETITQTRDEVAAFIKQETANIKVRVDQVAITNFETIYGEAYNGENSEHVSKIGKYQTSVSTDGGTTYTASGDPFAMEVTNYTASNGVQVENNNFSIKLKTGENVDSNLVVDGEGLSARVATVTYTPATTEGTTTAADLTVGDTTGLLDETAVSAIKSYVNAKADETQTTSVVTVEKLGEAEDGYVSSYVVKQNGTQVGATINIPKDYLVKSASVKSCETENQPVEGLDVGDKYIDFVINTAGNDGTESHIYLPVKELVKAYNGGDTDFINVAVSGENIITASAKTQTIADATEDANGLATALDVKTYVDTKLEENIPNVGGENAIEVTEDGTSKKVSLKLNDTEGETPHVSGLKQSDNGLEINTDITWILECGGAPVQE